MKETYEVGRVGKKIGAEERKGREGADGERGNCEEAKQGYLGVGEGAEGLKGGLGNNAFGN